MLRLTTDDHSLKTYEALASKPRLKIIDILSKQDMNLKNMTEQLGFSPATMTMHIRKLEDAGLVVINLAPGKHGHQKICSLVIDAFTGSFRADSPKSESDNYYHYSIEIGHYTDYSVKSTCGIASGEAILGQMDDPRYFGDPSHNDASILWFTSGFVEYRIPNYLLVSQQLMSVDISLELCSEAPGFNEQWPSDISFYLNGQKLGTWTSPGDFGKKQGVLTPAWWIYGTQYGLIKTIRVTEEGSFLDGLRLSDTSIRDLQIHRGKDLLFRIEVSEEAKHVGGVVLFGKDFGNYEQNIEVYLKYEPVPKEHQRVYTI